MAGMTTTTAAAAVAEFMNTLVDTLDYQGTQLRDLIPATPSQGDSAWRWPVHYAGNASTVDYSEGDAPTAAGQESYATASVAYSVGYKRTMYSVTGHARDQLRNGYFDAEEKNMTGAIAAHLDAREDKLISQLEAAVDSSGSYGGLLRATYKMASYEAAIGGSLALSDMDTMHETLTADPIGVDTTNFVVLSPVDTRGEYNDVMTGTGAGDALWLENKEGVTADGGRFKFRAAYNGAPWIEIKKMTSGGLIYIDPANIKRIVQRDLMIEPYAKNDDSDTYAITSCEILVVPDPREAGKLTT
jgi:hypothetical protein